MTADKIARSLRLNECADGSLRLSAFNADPAPFAPSVEQRTIAPAGQTDAVLVGLARACWRESVQTIVNDETDDAALVAQALVRLAETIETLTGAEASCGAREFWQRVAEPNGGRSAG